MLVKTLVIFFSAYLQFLWKVQMECKMEHFLSFFDSSNYFVIKILLYANWIPLNVFNLMFIRFRIKRINSHSAPTKSLWNLATALYHTKEATHTYILKKKSRSYVKCLSIMWKFPFAELFALLFTQKSTKWETREWKPFFDVLIKMKWNKPQKINHSREKSVAERRSMWQHRMWHNKWNYLDNKCLRPRTLIRCLHFCCYAWWG